MAKLVIFDFDGTVMGVDVVEFLQEYEQNALRFLSLVAPHWQPEKTKAVWQGARSKSSEIINRYRWIVNGFVVGGYSSEHLLAGAMLTHYVIPEVEDDPGFVESIYDLLPDDEIETTKGIASDGVSKRDQWVRAWEYALYSKSARSYKTKPRLGFAEFVRKYWEQGDYVAIVTNSRQPDKVMEGLQATGLSAEELAKLDIVTHAGKHVITDPPTADQGWIKIPGWGDEKYLIGRGEYREKISALLKRAQAATSTHHGISGIVAYGDIPSLDLFMLLFVLGPEWKMPIDAYFIDNGEVVPEFEREAIRLHPRGHIIHSFSQ